MKCAIAVDTDSKKQLPSMAIGWNLRCHSRQTASRYFFVSFFFKLHTEYGRPTVSYCAILRATSVQKEHWVEAGVRWCMVVCALNVWAGGVLVVYDD